MTQAPHLLRQILVKIAEHRRQGRESLVVFDLDSTLFDVGPRLERILLDFAATPQFQKKFPEQVKHFKKIKVERKDWGIKDALLRAGLDGHHPDFETAVRDFWRLHFFSNDYLKHDKPYDGAVEFVQKLHEAGALIAYLTGRDVQRMGAGSKKTLLDWNFPVDDRAELVLKPRKEMDDAKFKTDWFLNLPEGKFSDIWFFENEPVNVNMLRLQAAHVQIVFFDSTHSRQEEAPGDIPWVVNFLLDGTEK